MVALEEILHHDLPVGLDRIFPPLAKRSASMSAPADRMIAGNWPSVSANEHDAEPGLMKMKRAERLDSQRRQREVGLVESGLLLAVRGCAQGSVETPGPGVIVALEGAAVAALLQHQLAAPMAADVRVGPECPRLIADDDDRDLSHSAGQEVAGLRDLLDPADIVPARREDALLLALELLGVGVPLGGKGPPLGKRLVQYGVLDVHDMVPPRLL